MNSPTFRTRNATHIDLEKFGGIADRLTTFRQQAGIIDVVNLGPGASKRKARNIGIYNRVAREEREAKYQYIFSALGINTCLLAQVVFASALTALGAGHGSHTQITILGAANTVIAAVLTFTKGQGLPNRLRRYQCNLRRVREYIEQRERDFAQLDCNLDLDHELGRIKTMYQQARQNDEDNDPSTYHAPTASQPKEQNSSVGLTPNDSCDKADDMVPPSHTKDSALDDSKDEEDIAVAKPEPTNVDVGTFSRLSQIAI